VRGGLARKHAVIALVAPLVLALDQATKAAVAGRYFVGETRPVLGDFLSLTYVRNTGAAFGILAHADPAVRLPFFVAVPVVALAAISFIFRRIPRQDARLSSALALVIAGAVGNLIDRVRFGYVNDFLDFHWGGNHFPAFNVADAAICVGVGILMLDLLRERQESPSVAGSV
jgi:signal peptidase II